jgi:hypothetical protein
MDQRKLIVADYFKLYVLLNRSNKHRNEKTSLKFEFIFESADQLIFVASLEGSSNDAKIQLCHYDLEAAWIGSGYSSLNYFENFCAENFNEGFNFLKINFKKRKPNLEEMNHMMNRIKKELRGLGF